MKHPSIRSGLRTLLFALCLVAGSVATHAVQPSVQPVLPGKWPKWPQGGAYNVKVAGNHAYLAVGEGGIAAFDVSDPKNPVRVGGCDTPGIAYAVAVSGNYAYVADGTNGLQVIDVSNPTNCRRPPSMRR